MVGTKIVLILLYANAFYALEWMWVASRVRIDNGVRNGATRKKLQDVIVIFPVSR
jgi:hypothetical protein